MEQPRRSLLRMSGIGMRPRVAIWLTFVFAGVPGALSPQDASGIDGTIRGQVVDQRTDRGISGAIVDFLDTRDRIRKRTTTDEFGEFALIGLSPGPFSLRVTHPSFERTQTPHWWVEVGEVLSVTIRVDSEVIPLAPLEVIARARIHSPVLSGFYQRMNRGTTGTFIAREEIEERNPNRVTELLEMLPGVTLDHSRGQSARTVVMARALPGFSGPPPGARGDHSCPVQVWVDGVLATRGGAASPDEMVSPLDLEGIEVYRGMASVPAEFLTPEARCGVVVLWTRRRR